MIRRFPPTGYVLNPAAWAYRMSVRKGLLGGDRVWRVVLVAIVARRLLQRLMGATPATVAVEELKAGETLILRGVRSRKLPTS
jgi:hypothetical protein